MGVGIDKLKLALSLVVDAVNVQQKLMLLKNELPQLFIELKDCDESELMELVDVLKKLDLNDDQFEELIKSEAMNYAPGLALVLRLIRIFLKK